MDTVNEIKTYKQPANAEFLSRKDLCHLGNDSFRWNLGQLCTSFGTIPQDVVPLSTPEGVIQKNTVVADHLASERSKTQILLSLIYGV